MAAPWPDFELGDWTVDVSGNRLLRGDEVRPLRHKAMEVLVLLARHPGQTVSREQLEAEIWQGNRFVAPKAINTAVWTIRQALGDDPEAPRYLETIPKKGYRLVAPVRAAGRTLDVASPATAAPGTGPSAPPSFSLPPPPPSGPGPSAPTPRPGLRARGRALGLATGLGAVALAGLVWVQNQPPASPAAPAPAPAAAASGPAFGQVTPLTQEPGVEYLGALSPDGRQLAFAWWRGRGVGQLYLRDAADRSQPPRPLAEGAGEVQGLAWSPDSRALVFSATPAGGACTVWLQPLDGPRRALAACSSLFTPTVAWSPDGRHIAFSAEAEGAGGLFLVAPDGSGLRRLTTAAPAAMPDHQPAWHPDGQRLAFAREDPGDGSRDLYETGLDGQVQRLSTQRLHFLHGLSYLAGGQDLVFSTTQQDRRVLMRWDRAAGQARPLGLEGSAPTLAPGGGLVYALLRGHIGIARLQWRQPPERLLHALASDRAPRADSQGRAIAFVSQRSGTQELWVAQADGGQARALTSLAGLLAEPAWQPGGRQIAFLGHCGPGRRHGLCVIDADGGPARPLAADAAAYGRPAWHPSRPEIWVPSNRGGPWQLWRLPLDGSAAEAVATAEPPGRALQWAADGRSLVYQPNGAQHLQWKPLAGAERRIEVTATGEALVDWRLQGGAVLTLSRGDRERWRRLDLASGRRQALGEHPLGSFPERASFDLLPDGSVLVEVANTDVADIMLAR